MADAHTSVSNTRPVCVCQALKKRVKAIENVGMVDGYAGPHQIESTVLRDLRRAVTRMYPKHTRKRSSLHLNISRRNRFEHFLLS